MKQPKTNAPSKLFAAILLLAAAAATYAQGDNPQTPAASTNQTQNVAQTAPPQNVPAALSFTPQQEEQWRQINREFRTQEVAAAAKVRDARLALNEAIESPSHNEGMIKQRAKELADAQSAVTELQALRQSRVLQILTPEQRTKLKQLREERAREARRQQSQVNSFDPRQRIRRNSNNSILTPAQRKALRQPQKPKP